MKTYTPTIGIEVHAELKTATKMFCDSKNNPHHAEPNVHVCPTCMGHPGTLPTINKRAVEHVLSVGLALGGELASYTEFDRKNYFYPDIPKGYQISQYLYPLVKGGSLAGVAVTRVHLEEDTARSLHDQGEGSIVDYNRAGVPLMELVTEPVIHDAKTAGNFARELQLLLRTLGVSDANMEKGEMRVEANISVSGDTTLGTKVEVKNLNSFKSVESAITYEIRRQIEVLEKNGQITQETRGFDESKGKTFSQRTKESAHDYRYFPDPDLPKLELSESTVSRIRETMPELPDKKREKYRELGLTIEQVEIIIGDIETDNFFKRGVTGLGCNRESVRLFANYLVTDLLGMLKEGEGVGSCCAEMFVKLVEMLAGRRITSRVAKDILREVAIEGKDPEMLTKERGLAQNDSREALMAVVETLIAGNSSVADEYKSGKEAALQYLVGQGMKLSKGSANPKLLAELIREKLG